MKDQQREEVVDLDLARAARGEEEVADHARARAHPDPREEEEVVGERCLHPRPLVEVEVDEEPPCLHLPLSREVVVALSDELRAVARPLQAL